MSESMNDKLKRRKLDALKRGVHRMAGGEVVTVTSHVVGIGKAGAAVVAALVRSHEAGAPRLSALVIDIGDQDLGDIRALADAADPDHVRIAVVSLTVPDDIASIMGEYPRYLALEYPRYSFAAFYHAWLAAPAIEAGPDGHVPRAVAKAIYGASFYGGSRSMQRALRMFADDIEASAAQAVIAIVFGLGGGTGSGIAIDLARHLSCRMFGRRALVAGIAILPCGGDAPVHSGAALFPALNELDCLGDEGKNQGVVAACGELFRNPFTAGFIAVPQQHVWDATGDLAATHARVDGEVAALLTGRQGINLWETLRLLNWVAAPSTQHSAARTPWGAKWIHMLAFADADGGAVALDGGLPKRLGIVSGYAPEFIEIRVQTPGDAPSAAVAVAVEDAFRPDVPPQRVGGGEAGRVQFILPCLSKTDLVLFFDARDAYDDAGEAEKLLVHAMLLEQGVLLCEKSTRLDGMAGASLQGGPGWVAVPFDAIRGGEATPLQPPIQPVREFGYAT